MKLEKRDGVRVRLGDRVEVTKKNAEQYRGVLGDELTDEIKKSRGNEEAGIYEVTAVGGDGCPSEMMLREVPEPSSEPRREIFKHPPSENPNPNRRKRSKLSKKERRRRRRQRKGT